MEYHPAPWDNAFQGKWTTALSKLTLSPGWHFATFLGALLPLGSSFLSASGVGALCPSFFLSFPLGSRPVHTGSPSLTLPVSLRAVSPGLTSSHSPDLAAPAICFLDTTLGLSHRCSHSACPRASSPFLPSVRAFAPSCPVGISLNDTAVCQDAWLKSEPLSPFSSLPGPGYSPGLVGSDSQMMLMILESLPIFLALVLCSASLVSLQSFFLVLTLELSLQVVA